MKTARGVVFRQPVVDILGEIPQVDLAGVYGIDKGTHSLAVAAVSARPGASLTIEMVNDALRVLLPERRPDVVQFVDDIPLTASYRPKIGALRSTPPEPGERTFYYDAADGSYRVLTESVAAELLPS